MLNTLAPRRLSLASLLLGVMFVVGCGSQIKLVPVEGVLKINGKPAADVSIQFQPDIMKGSKGPTSYANTDAEGKFRLKTTDNRDGAVVGTHRVVLTDLNEERPPQGKPMRNQPRLDAKYTMPTTGLVVEIKDGGGPLTLEAHGPRR